VGNHCKIVSVSTTVPVVFVVVDVVVEGVEIVSLATNQCYYCILWPHRHTYVSIQFTQFYILDQNRYHDNSDSVVCDRVCVFP